MDYPDDSYLWTEEDIMAAVPENLSNKHYNHSGWESEEETVLVQT